MITVKESINTCKGCGYHGTGCIMILHLHDYWCRECYEKLKALGVV